MRYEQWRPAYLAILDDFGYDEAADERARDVLAGLASGFDTAGLALAGRRVAVCGAGPSLPAGLGRARTADIVIAASTAVDTCLDAGVDVDLMTTDLDKNPETARRLTRRGVPVAVHAHGDNVAALREEVPAFDDEFVLPTTQTRPRAPVENFGGFTDGDRGAFLADHLGAAELVFAGWDFEDPSVGDEKRHKLRWAARLLRWLERRRDEHFAVLDGRRERIDSAWQPPEG